MPIRIVVNDCNLLIVGGDIIACKGHKTKILYPRARPFLTRLPGSITATPGQQNVNTTADLRSDIRRGDAIGVAGSWFRVSCSVKSSGSHKLERATAPLSVTSDRDMSEKNVYVDEFDAGSLPLDGDYDGEENFTGQAMRHGAPNDIRDCWARTLQTEEFREVTKDPSRLQRELLHCKLVTRAGTVSTSQKKGKAKEKPTRKRKARETTSQFNEHLRGSALGELLRNSKEG